MYAIIRLETLIFSRNCTRIGLKTRSKVCAQNESDALENFAEKKNDVETLTAGEKFISENCAQADDKVIR